MIANNVFKRSVCLIIALMIMFSLALTAAAKKTDNIHSPNYDFTSSDGSHITNPHNNGKTTLMIFFTEDCVYSSQLINDLANADWVDPRKLSVIAIGHGITGNAQLKKYADTYAKGSNKIKFCYCNDVSFNDFCAAVGVSGQVAVPVVFIINSVGKIVDYTTGGISSATVRETLSNYVQGLKLPKKIKVSIKGTLGYKEAFAVLDLINVERAKAGLQPVKMDKQLLNDAMKRAEECLVFYDHTRPDGSNFNTIDGNFSDMSENIAMGYHNAADVMKDWMASPGHKANIMNPNAQSVGIGVFYQQNQKSWSQEFSSKAPATVATVIPNETKTETVSFLEEHLKLKLSRSKESLSIGETDTVYAYINPWEDSPQQTLVDNSCLTYKTANPKVATVSAVGVITPVGVGTTNLTVSLNDSNQQAVIPVTVYPESQSHEANTNSNPGLFKPTQSEDTTSSVTQVQKPANTTPSSQPTVSIAPSKPAESSKPASSVASKPTTSSKLASSVASKPTASSKPTSSAASKPTASSKPENSAISKPAESIDSSSALSSEETSGSMGSEILEDIVSKEEIAETETEADGDTLTIGATEEKEKKPISTVLIVIIAVAALAVIGGISGIIFFIKKVK